MLQSKRISSDQSFLSIPTQIRGMVQNDIDLLEVASRFHVRPGTVRKIISGHPVSPYVRWKVHTTLEEDRKLMQPSKQSPVQELLEINRLYQEIGTLRAVGEKVGLSRERVRQLLSKGSNLGLFKYKPKKPPVISRKKILSDYKKYLNLNEVAKANKISLPYLQRLRMFHKIEREDLHPIRERGQRRQCIQAYASLRDQIGHYPTTTELQRLKKGRYLQSKIHRLWGSFSAFREALNFHSRPLKSCI